MGRAVGRPGSIRRGWSVGRARTNLGRETVGRGWEVVHGTGWPADGLGWAAARRREEAANGLGWAAAWQRVASADELGWVAALPSDGRWRALFGSQQISFRREERKGGGKREKTVSPFGRWEGALPIFMKLEERFRSTASLETHLAGLLELLLFLPNS